MGAGEAFQGHPASVRAEALTLARGDLVLIDALSFQAKPGAYIEIRGPNGSGKTTLLRALAGFLKPRAGRLVFEGVEEPALALHHLGHLNGLKQSASVVDHARYWRGLLGGDGDVSSALSRLGLARIADFPARFLSQGQQRRLALSRLLLAPRPVWLLDEPNAGLDDQGRALLTEMIDAHCGQGGIVFAAMHGALGATPSQTLSLGA